MVVEASSGNGRVPSALPPILKSFTKAAIKTQPGDLIAWSYAYFNSLMQGESPPVKEHIEYPLPHSENGVTPGLLRVLHKKLGSLDIVPRAEYDDLCQAMGVRDLTSSEAWDNAGGDAEAEWDLLLVHLVAPEEKTVHGKLVFVMQSICEDPIHKKVPVETTLKYFDLIHDDEEPDMVKLHEEVKDFLTGVASRQDDELTPSDITRPLCPIKDIDG